MGSLQGRQWEGTVLRQALPGGLAPGLCMPVWFPYVTTNRLNSLTTVTAVFPHEALSLAG